MRWIIGGRRLRFRFALSLIVVAIRVAYAGGLDDAVASDELYLEAIESMREDQSSKGMKRAASFLKKAAIADHPKAQHLLGVFHLYGHGVRKSQRMATKWFIESASHGYPSAQFQAGMAYLMGVGVDPDEEEAKRLFSEIVAPSSPQWIDVEDYAVNRRLKADASYYLATMGSSGPDEGASSEEKLEMLSLLEDASRNGSNQATIRLAMEYAKGAIVERNVEKTKEYLDLYHLMLSDETRRVFDGVGLSEAVVTAIFGERDSSPGVDLNQALYSMIYSMIVGFAELWYESMDRSPEVELESIFDLLQIAVDGGFERAKVVLGVLYCTVGDSSEEYEQAFHLLSETSVNDVRLSGYNLGTLYWKGLGVEQDKEAALTHFRRASDEGLYAARLILDGDREPEFLNYRELYEFCLQGREEKDPRAEYSFLIRQENAARTSGKMDHWYFFDSYLKVAKRGHEGAMAKVGERYYQGEGVARDDKKAIQWLSQAAEKGVSGALFRLGYMHEFGQGVSKDFEKAVEYYKRSSDLGHAIAKNNLGGFYYNGRFVQRDPVRAIALWEDAADSGLSMALGNLGVAYHRGQGVEKDIGEAIEYYGRAAESGSVKAAYALVKLFQQGGEVAQDDVEATYWMEKACEYGDVGFMMVVASRYHRGEHVPENYSKAMYWASRYLESSSRYSTGSEARARYDAYLIIADSMATPGWEGYDRKAARNMFRDLQDWSWFDSEFMLAKHYRSGSLGDGMEKNAFRLFQTIAKKAGPESEFYGKCAYELAKCYREGAGTRESRAKWIDWLEKAEKAGDAAACYELAMAYNTGEEVEKDLARGYQLMQRSSSLRYSPAHYWLARHYIQTEPESANATKAYEWLEQKAREGNTTARTILRENGKGWKEAPVQEDSDPNDSVPYWRIQAA